VSLRTVLISIIVAGALGALVILDAALWGGGAGDTEVSARRTIGLDAQSIRTLRVERPDRGVETLSRDETRAGAWTITLPGDPPWPADAARVRLILRTIASAPIEPAGEERLDGPDQAPEWTDDAAGRVRLGTESGASCELVFDARSVARLRRVLVTRRDEDGIVTRRETGRLDEGIADALLGGPEGRGPAAWRDPALFPWSLGEVGALELAAGASRVTLERSGPAWLITEPWRVGAQPDPIDATLRSVLALSAASFLDQEAPGAITGLDNPRARIVVRPRVGADPIPGAVLEIGTPSTLDASRVHARYTPSGADQGVLIEIASERVARLTASPMAYVRATPVRAAPARIDSVRITDPGASDRAWTATRDLDAWAVNAGPTTPRERDRIDAFVRLIADTPADAVTPPSENDTTEPDPGAPILHVLSLRGDEDTRFALTLNADDPESALTLRRLTAPGVGFAWTYRAASLGELADWLGSKLGN